LGADTSGFKIRLMSSFRIAGDSRTETVAYIEVCEVLVEGGVGELRMSGSRPHQAHRAMVGLALNDMA